ncbi:hypothetical protein IU510_22925 [Nocardia cyriacigeorgica]|uniref:Uncharacterized protein n=1 Tax=Nocardia cyriacigeorgica TaxID=135487 RepID=A0A2L2JN65_9NOCA|nr:hypothetical protein [Nocardia cyriacigeorgica]AVH21299.1 hypothetical protein C5B73_07270 [Nocardia cyriacigeorgica]MBF6100906.1 hypothetical protein [Nocardia cyriacigeorgica]MBF6160365.1 hypothetical protein [Nocardia cyriacigeorgica]MBF6199450.1 hypothetical protein [Nocardia cyriacigeorgica]MBF6287862.1 hypothetical protein [Nocardia cyriacigeorgica]
MREPSIRARSSRGFGASLLSLLFTLWLVIGFVAAFQRDYFTAAPAQCRDFATIALTVVSGPLNYAGLNPRVEHCTLPEPSQ